LTRTPKCKHVRERSKWLRQMVDVWRNQTQSTRIIHHNTHGNSPLSRILSWKKLDFGLQLVLPDFHLQTKYGTIKRLGTLKMYLDLVGLRRLSFPVNTAALWRNMVASSPTRNLSSKYFRDVKLMLIFFQVGATGRAQGFISCKYGTARQRQV
jgi:hypothetical protein